MPITVLIAEDHQVVRQGVKALMEDENFKVVGEATNGQDALRLAREIPADVAILDISMPVLNGIDAAREIRRFCPRTKTVFLTIATDRQYILEGLRAGAKGYVMKTNAASELAHAVREAAKGASYLSPEVGVAVVKAFQDKTKTLPQPLSPRERQVLQLIAEGKTTKEAADAMAISVKTAETYRTRIMDKLGMHITADLVRYAIRQGLIEA